jgi:hypothetical protein
MRTTTNRVLFVALLISAALSAQDGPRGRWTGSIDIPGHTAAVEIDLDKTAKGWVGSMALPVQKASGIPLEAIAFADGKWTFRIKGLPEAPTFTGTLSADGLTLSGDFAQGDASFPFQLSRAGDAQVAATKPSPAVPREFLGTWEGTLLDQGVPKRMVFKIANDESGASAVLIASDDGAEIPVAAIEHKDAELKLLVKAIGVEYWGELNSDGTQLTGSWTQSEKSVQLKFKKKGGDSAKAIPSQSPAQSQAAAQNLPLPAAQQKQAEPPPALPSKPLSAEHEKIVADARAIALDYSRRLPDFICLQLTRRYDDPLGESGFVLQDTVAAQLTYFEQKEDYKVISRKANYKVAPKNDKWTGSSSTSLDGVTSSGEFGTLLKDIFEPRTHADFWFQRRGSLHRHVTLIFGYRVPARNSKWRIEYNPGALVCTTEYTGSLFIDPETHAVMRVSMEARRIPTSFPVQDVWIQLDYAWQDLAGEKFLLPSTVVLNMREGRVNKKNEIDFRSYRKYSAASAVTFEADSAGAISDENQKDKQQSTRPRQ